MSNGRFMHDYYFPPTEDSKPRRATVLCMNCAMVISSSSLTVDDIKERYKEKKIVWISQNGLRGDGVILLCKDCINIPVTSEDIPLIIRQIDKAFEDEAKSAKLPKSDVLNKLKIELLEV
jgi:hypothetical protein